MNMERNSTHSKHNGVTKKMGPKKLNHGIYTVDFSEF